VFITVHKGALHLNSSVFRVVTRARWLETDVLKLPIGLILKDHAGPFSLTLKAEQLCSSAKTVSNDLTQSNNPEDGRIHFNLSGSPRSLPPLSRIPYQINPECALRCYKVVQILPGQVRLVYTQISTGHIWTTLYFFNISCNIILPSTPRSSKWFLSQVSSSMFLPSLHARYINNHSHSSSLHHSDNICREVQIMKLLGKFPPTLSSFFPHTLEYLPQQLISNSLSLCSRPQFHLLTGFVRLATYKRTTQYLSQDNLNAEIYRIPGFPRHESSMPNNSPALTM
jgi:hypothetical protein